MLVLAVGTPAIAHATRTDPSTTVGSGESGAPIELPAPPGEPLRPELPTPPSEPPTEPPSVPDGPRGPVDLLSPRSLARIAGMDLPDAPMPEDDDVSRAERRVDHDLGGTLRRDAIGAGHVDGYHHELGRAMRGALHVDPLDLQADGIAGRSIPEIALGELGRYGGFERPIEPRGTLTPELSRRTMDADEVQLDELMDFQNLLNGHVTWHRAEIRVHVNRAGEIVRVELLRSSGRPSVDRAAIEAAHDVAPGVPPERVLGDRGTITSDWAIEVGDVSSHYGVAGCTEPTEALTGGCAALGRGLLRTRVELLDVADATFAEETPSTSDREKEGTEAKRTEAT